MELIVEYRAEGETDWQEQTQRLTWSKPNESGPNTPLDVLQVALHDGELVLAGATWPVAVLPGATHATAITARLMRADGQTFRSAGMIRMKPA